MLRLYGWPIKVAATSASRRKTATQGDPLDSDMGVRLLAPRRQRPSLAFETAVLTEQAAQAVEALAGGLVDSWSWDANLFSARGVPPLSSAGASIGAGGIFNDCLNLAASANLTYDMSHGITSFGGPWTLMIWRKIGVTWTHHVIRDDGAVYVSGVRDDATDVSWLSVSGASFTLHGGTIGNAFDSALLVQASLPNDAIAALYQWHAVDGFDWPAIPVVPVDGDAAAGFAGYYTGDISGQTYTQAAMLGAWRDNGRKVRFSLTYNSPAAAASIAPPAPPDFYAPPDYYWSGEGSGLDSGILRVLGGEDLSTDHGLGIDLGIGVSPRGGNAFLFGLAAGHGSAPGTHSLYLPDTLLATNPFTLAFWARVDTDTGPPGTGFAGQLVASNGSSKTCFLATTGDEANWELSCNARASLSTSNRTPFGSWAWVTIRCAGGPSAVPMMYLNADVANGHAAFDSGLDGFYDTTGITQVCFGANFVGTQPLDGAIADIALWNRVITDQEMIDAYDWIQSAPFATRPPASSAHGTAVITVSATGTTIPAFSPAPTTYYKFDATVSGSIPDDGASGGFPASLSGGTFDATNKIVNKSLSLTRSSYTLQAAGAVLDSGGAAVGTIAGWFYLASNPGGRATIWAKGHSGGDFTLLVDSNVMKWYYANATHSDVTISLGAWNHFACVWNSGSGAFYLNGSLLTTLSGISPQGDTLQIGYDTRYGGDWTSNIQFDEFFIGNNVALLGSDVLALYNRGIAGNALR